MLYDGWKVADQSEGASSDVSTREAKVCDVYCGDDVLYCCIVG